MSALKLLRKALMLALPLAAALTLTSSKDTSPRYHYEVRRDLSVYFTNADSVIESVRSSLRSRSPRFIISYTSHGDNMEDMGLLVRELMELALSETDRADEGDYLACNMGGYSFEFGYDKNGRAYDYEITVTPELYTDAEQERRVTERVQEIVAGLGLREMDSGYEKARAVHGYLCENVGYDDIHKRNEHYHLKSTAYGALINGHAVCQGYCAAAYRLLREAGIECRVVTGLASIDGSEEYHAWNIVKIDGRWYNMDVTWDDQLDTDEFFLAGSQDFGDHHPDERFTTEEFMSTYPLSDKGYQEN